MGRILFIRVSAETYDEKDVIRAWPKLYALVWPEAGADPTAPTKKIIRSLVPDQKRGVLQLADAFVEYAHFGDVPEKARQGLKACADTLERLRAELDDALGNRDVQTASKLTNAIEDALDDAEKTARDAS